MEKTVFDLDLPAPSPSPSQAPSASWRWRILGAAMGVAALLLVLWGVIVLLPQQEPVLLQSRIALPDPAPLSPPAITVPAVTVTPPPVAPPAMPLAAQRPSIWEIRAELKRGTGEWEFPHYLNAPHYGAGPDSPLPALAKPHLGTVWLGE